MPATWDPNALPPGDGVQRLMEGNRRFLDSMSQANARLHRPELAGRDQRPFAIVLGCSDSRTPVETLFDQGFGDLFVVRVAGNIVAPSVVGSIEFAASQYGTRLVVVLGHTECGAVAAAIKAIRTGHGHESANIRSITDRIEPHIETVVSLDGTLPDATVQRLSMQANVRASVDHLRHGSRLLEELVMAGRIAVVGAEYELATGAVQMLDAVPEPPPSGRQSSVPGGGTAGDPMASARSLA